MRMIKLKVSKTDVIINCINQITVEKGRRLYDGANSTVYKILYG